jgi:DNA-directed RNA polymerase subunit RPC12/RpoP
MRLEQMDCNNCGAPLEVPENVQFARCAHCGSRLRVHRDTSVHYTEVLDRIEKSTQRLEGEVRALQLQLELRDLDDAWEKERQGLMLKDEKGQLRVPSRDAGFGILAAMAAIAVVIGIMVLAGGASPEMCFLVLVGGIVGLGVAGYQQNKAAAYYRAETAYKAKRQLILRRIAAARAPAA